MIRLTRLTDYGIVLLTHLEEKAEDRRKAGALAECTGLPLPMASKILKRLAGAGLVRSWRGAQGGYCLARPAAEISVADVIVALDGPIAITECTDESSAGECSYESLCQVRQQWQRINTAVRSALEEVSLSEMSAPAETPPDVSPLVHLDGLNSDLTERTPGTHANSNRNH